MIILLAKEAKKTFSKTPLIEINSDELKLNGEHHTWSNVVSFIITEETNPGYFRTIDTYLQFEFIGHTEDTRILVDKLNISKHDLVNLLASVQKRYMNHDQKTAVE